MLLIVSSLLYLAVSLPVSVLLFGSLRFNRWIISFFLTAFTINVFIAEVSGIFHILDQKWIFLLIQVILCSGTMVTILHWKPALLQNCRNQWIETWKEYHLLDFVLMAVMIVLLGGILLIGLSTPPNNIDSLHSHLPRIYYWLQHGSFASWQASSMAQLTYPINAHIQGLWLFLMSSNENTFFLVQWFSMLVTVCVVFELAQLLDFNHRQSLTAALVLLSFPAVLLQAYSFQGDLTVTALIMVCILLAFSYLKEKRLLLLILSMLPLALALGTKQTAFFFLPAAGLFIFLWSLTGKIQKKHIPWLGMIIGFFLLLSSFQFIQNVVERDSLFGQEIISDIAADPDYRLMEKFKYNAPRLVFQFISFDGVLQRFAVPLQNLKASIFKSLTGSIHLNLEDTRYLQPGFDPSEAFHYDAPMVLGEDNAWYGPLSFLLLPAALIAAAFRKESLIRQYLLFVLTFTASYILILLWQRPGWDPYQGRYFFLGFAPLLPLVAALIPRQKYKQTIITILVCATVLTLGLSTIFFNQTKPILTQNLGYQWSNQYVEMITPQNKAQLVWKIIRRTAINAIIDSGIGRTSILQSNYLTQMFFNNTGSIVDVEFANSFIPRDAELYLCIHHNPMEFALFGKNRTRQLYPLEYGMTVSDGAYLLTDQSCLTDIDLSSLTLLATNEQYAIYQK